MNRIVFITPHDAKYGFMLTGVSQYIVSKEDLIDTLKIMLQEQNTGLIIIDERLLNEETFEYIREVEQKWHGILLVLPAPVQPTIEIEDYAARLIRRAIGYHVRLKI